MLSTTWPESAGWWGIEPGMVTGGIVADGNRGPGWATAIVGAVPRAVDVGLGTGTAPLLDAIGVATVTGVDGVVGWVTTVGSAGELRWREERGVGDRGERRQGDDQDKGGDDSRRGARPGGGALRREIVLHADVSTGTADT